MITTLKLSLYLRSLRLAAFLLLAGVAGTGRLALAQETLEGKLTLPVAARVGSTILPAGEYKLTAQLLTSDHSLDSIHHGYRPIAVLLASTSKGGPAAGIIALAMRPDANTPKSAAFLPDGNGMALHSISLDNMGIVIQFMDGASKNTLNARAPQSAPVTIAAKGK